MSCPSHDNQDGGAVAAMRHGLAYLLDLGGVGDFIRDAEPIEPQ